MGSWQQRVDRAIDAFVWIALLVILALGVRVGFDDAIADGMPQRTNSSGQISRPS